MRPTSRWTASLSRGMRSLFTLSYWGTRQPWKVTPATPASAPPPRWRTVRGGGDVTPRGPRGTGQGARAA